MRTLFSRQLIAARHEMLSIYEAVDLTLHDAVKAYVEGDKKLAKRTEKATLQADARSANLEAVCYNLIATQSPVASDFRLLQTIIYVNFNLQRMNEKVRRLAHAAKQRVKSDIELSKELLELLGKEAEKTYLVLGASISAIVSNDLSKVLELSRQDEDVHNIYQKFFREFNRLDLEKKYDDKQLDDLRRVAMASRYLDRIAQISIDAASRLVFLLTGQRLSAEDLAELELDELDSMRVPSGEGVTLDPKADAKFVSAISPDEVGSELADLVAEAAAEDGGAE